MIKEIWKCEKCNRECLIASSSNIHNFKPAKICTENFIEYDPEWEPTNCHKILSISEIEELKKEAVEEFKKKVGISFKPVFGEPHLDPCIFAKSTHCDIPAWLNCNETNDQCVFSDKKEKSSAPNKPTPAPPLPKEPELMTLQEAFDKADDEDMLLLDTIGISYKYKKNEILKQSVTGGALVEKIWQIIPAEPVVLSAEEIAKSVTYRDVNTYCWSDILQICETAVRNGQLKEWQNHKKLREAVLLFLETYPPEKATNAELVYKIKDAFVNLKPLNPE